MKEKIEISTMKSNLVITAIVVFAFIYIIKEFVPTSVINTILS